jgi:hypothetical protein
MKLRALLQIATVFLLMHGSQAEAAIVQALENDGQAYFLATAPARVERYELSQRQWLAPIPLPSTRGNPTVAAIDSDSIFVAYGTNVYRYALDGSGETHLLNAQYPVLSLHLDGNIVIVSFSNYINARLASFNKSTNALIAEFSGTSRSPTGASLQASANRIFGRTTGISPSDICYVSYTDTGAFVEGKDSPYHGDYANASKTWVFPNQAKVVDNSGIVYSTGDLSYVGSLAGAFDDIAFSGTDVPVVVRGREVVAHTPSLLPTGSKALNTAPYKIYVDGADVVAFSTSSSEQGLSVEILPLAELNAPTPGLAVNPVGLPFVPDATFLANDGQLYLFSKGNQSIFRWNPVTQTYGETIPLIGVPNFVTYAAELNRIYVAYPSGLIRKIDLSDPELKEVPFYNLPAAPAGLSMAGTYLFAVDPSGAWNSHYTISRFGLLVDSEDWNYYSTEFIWSPANQKMYFFRDDSSPNDLIWEEVNANGTAYPSLSPGHIGLKKDSPLHDSAGFIHPIRVSHDGSTVVLGSGKIHNGLTLERSVYSLSNAVADIAWLSTTDLRTIRSEGTNSQYQQWTGTAYAPGLVKQYPGTAHRLLNLSSNRLLGISLGSDRRPSYYVLDQNFEIQPPAQLAQPAALAVSALAPARVPLNWADVSGETSYIIERKTTPEGSWSTIATTGVSETAFVDITAINGLTYAYRVTAKNGESLSEPSDELAVSLAIPATPTDVIGVATSPTIVDLSWPAVDGASSYRVEYVSQWNGTVTQLSTIFTEPKAKISGLQGSTMYLFRVRAVNVFGASPLSYHVAVQTAMSPPAAPILSLPYSSVGSITLTWSDVAGEDNYYVWRRESTSSTWLKIATLPAGTLTYKDSDVTAGVRYDYFVQSYSIYGTGSSAVRTALALTPPALPSAPPFIISSPNSSSSIAIYWATVSGATSYKIERTFDGQNWHLVAVTASIQNYYTDTGLRANTYHQYRVRATNAGGDSLPSSTALSSTLSKLAEWRLQYFGTTADSGPASSLATGTDGVSNLMKFASNLAPNESARIDEASATKGTATVGVNPVNNRLRVTFVRFRSSANPGINYQVQFSSSFGSWETGGAEVQAAPIDDTWERVVWEDQLTLDESPRRFARVKVTEQP